MESQILQRAIFLDRDGVINKEVKYLFKIEDFRFINGVFTTCKYFTNLGYKIIIVSNQSGISRGYYSEDEYQKITQWMIEQFDKNEISILDTFHCPHHSDFNCECRKPKPGMFIHADIKYGIDFDNSWLIGDKETDIEAANQAGITNTILVRSGHNINEAISNSKFIIDSIKEASQVIKN